MKLVLILLLSATAGCAATRSPEDAALSRVAQLPEIRLWTERVSSLSKGEVKLILRIDGYDGDAWTVQAAEDHDTHLATLAWYSVNRDGTVRRFED